MSSAGVSVVNPQAYFCHQCNRTVSLTPSPNSDISCPNCNGGFLEEFDSPNPNPNPNQIGSGNPFASAAVIPDPFSLLADPFLFAPSSRGPIMFSSTSIDLENPRNFSRLFAPAPSPSPAFDAFGFLQGHLQNLRASGANFQIVVENHPSEPALRLPPNFGDYFLGPGLEQLIQLLAENDPNRYGTPPASKKAIETLPDVTITDEIAKSDSNSCAVCMDDFEVGSQGKQMPCKHLFHSDCLLPWLELHNSCPVCRHELPTDDQDYENRKVGREQGTSSSSSTVSSGGGGSSSGEREGGGGGRSVERRFRISLPWPFSAFAVASEGNNDGGEGRNDDGGNENSADSNRGSSSGDQQSGNGGSEPRQESLD